MGDIDPTQQVQQQTPRQTTLVDAFAEQKRVIDAILRSNPLENAIIGEGGLLVRNKAVIRSESFDGHLHLDLTGTTGWALGSDRLVLMGADVVPVQFDGGRTHEGNFVINDTTSLKARRTVPVPKWADEAMVMVVAMMSANNDSGSSGLLNGQTAIDGNDGQSFNKSVSAGDTFDVTLAQSALITVTGRETFDIDGYMWLNAGDPSWGPNATNNCALNTNIMFRRVP